MDFLKINIKLTSLVTSLILVACAQNFPPSPKGADALPPLSGLPDQSGQGNDQKSEQSSLSGEFKTSNGTVKKLSELQSKPTILIFAGEFCSTCREETEALSRLFLEKGEPTEVNIVTILVGSSYQDINNWVDTFTPIKPNWTIGADDDDLTLYKKYFTKLVTPSVMYFKPKTNEVKRFQSKLTIDQLQKETAPWY